MDTRKIDELEGSIAIIGMSGRLPGAKNIDEFWHNLKNGVESVTFFSDEELIASGIDPAILTDKNYVKAKGVLDNIAEFDATFFGLSPKEAQLIDPQHRLFLECAWEALEHAGYDPKTYSGSIGVYGGVGGEDTYLLQNLYANHLKRNVEHSQIFLGNDKDFLCNRVSYKLNLNGPSITVQTACSTSLVAVVTGYQSLLYYQCDMALAGGAAISLPQKAGYFYREGMILSPDGHCRAFDAKAQGTVSGNGVGIVVLKRLEDALAEGDHIYAIIRGAAINNDGASKAGFTAPSVEAQAQVIAEALSLAETPAETMSYVEAHGTGTPLGDPIEIAALSQAFDAERTGYCALGSVKTNIGHLDAAAGVAGLIKTVLALKHQLLPASLHFEQPNPKIDFANSPFYVNTRLSEWKTPGFPRRAGVSSFGMGGTNAHVILEEAPQIPQIPQNPKIPPNSLLLLSAKTDTALETATTQLVEHLKQHPHLNLADVAYTYQVGRCAFSQRRMLVCQSLEEAVNALETRDAQRVFNHALQTDEEPSVVFMFSGQGAQYVNMGLELYQTEPVFREQVDRCAEFIGPHLGQDLRSVLYPALQIPPSPPLLKKTAIIQPALFVIEYALAQLWMSWGVQPKAMIGHSLGEYVAACLAGVFSLEEALVLVAARGRLMQSVPAGAMLAVPLSEDEIRPLLNIDTELAAVNMPTQCVVSGTTAAVEQFATQLAEQDVACKRVPTCDAFHSKIMSPILTPLLEQLQQIQLKPPQIPFLSNVTGTWIRAEEATSPHYWVKHARQTVRFASELQQVLQQPQLILLEVGPGRTLTTFAKRHPDNTGQLVLSSLGHSKSEQSESTFLLNTLGKLWMAGVTVNWSAFYADEQRYRLPLPTYPFERQRYWIEAQQPVQHKITASQLWQSLVEATQRQAQQDVAEFDNPAYVEKYQWLNRLSAAYVNLALSELGAFSNPAEQYSHDELLRQFHILPFYRQMLPRCLTALVEHGYLQQQGEKFTHLTPLSREVLNTIVEEVETRWTKTHELPALVQLCGERFAAILTGEENPKELLFTGTAFETLQNLYRNSPESRYFGTLVQASLKQIVKSLPSETHLRILEIGAGTGATTAYLLQELPPQRTHYVFTDVGPSFLSQAQQKFSEYTYIEYRLLDIEQSPTEQGYESHRFDIVIAAQVLHATKNLGQTLEHVRSLLAPEGFLFLWEPTRVQILYFDVFLPIMQPFDENDELRSHYPFITIEQWYEAIHKYGFVKVNYFPKTDALDDHLFVAQAYSSAILPSAFTKNVQPQEVVNTFPKFSERKPDVADWFYIPSWKLSRLPRPFSENHAFPQQCWLVFLDEGGLGSQLVKRLEQEKQDVITVRTGKTFTSHSEHAYTLNPEQPEGYNALLNRLRTLNKIPKTIVHLWRVTPSNHSTTLDYLEESQNLGFYSLFFLAQALGKQNWSDAIQMMVVSNHMQEVTGGELHNPDKATLLGAVKVIPQEYSHISCRSIDIVLPESGSHNEQRLIDQLWQEFTTKATDFVIAYRDNHRWTQTFEPVRLEEVSEETPRLRKRGVYLITGGFGAMGLAFAEYFAKTVQAKLILVGRSDFPLKKNGHNGWLRTMNTRVSAANCGNYKHLKIGVPRF